MSDTGSDADAPPVPKLNTKNYETWSIQFSTHLMLHYPQIWDLLRGQGPTAQEGENGQASTPSTTDVDNFDRLLAHYLLSQAVSPSTGFHYFINIEKENDPKVIWDQLRLAYRKQLDIWDLRHELYNVRLVDYDDFVQYETRIRALINTYNFAVGDEDGDGGAKKLTNAEKTFFYYNGLPTQDETWDSFILALRMEDRFRHDVELLLRSMRRMAELLVNKGEWGRARRRRRVTCYKCHRKGHYQNECTT